MSVPEVQFEPEAPTAPPSVGAPGPGAGGARSLPERVPPRPFYGHRLISLPTGMDWCVGCGGTPDPTVECRPGQPRCDSCGTFPADYNEDGFRTCSSCRNGGRP